MLTTNKPNKNIFQSVVEAKAVWMSR